jgi:uncharacterized membrane protein
MVTVNIRFRISYIVGPLMVLALTIALVAFFYHLLPARVGYHFNSDGTPDLWLSRTALITLGLGLQFLFTLVAAGCVFIARLLGRQTGTSLSVEGIVQFMGNVLAFPQLVVVFVMADILSYNAYQTHFMPMWIFLLAVIGLATVGLGVFTGLVFSKMRRETGKK